jgi:hypothetical protein
LQHKIELILIIGLFGPSQAFEGKQAHVIRSGHDTRSCAEVDKSFYQRRLRNPVPSPQAIHNSLSKDRYRLKRNDFSANRHAARFLMRGRLETDFTPAQVRGCPDAL